MTLRSLIFWPHLVAGACAGLVILLMSVTGVLLTYERQMIAWSDRDFRSEPAQAGQARLPLETLMTRFTEATPGVTPTAVTIESSPDAPVVFGVPQRTIYMNAYTGAVLGEGSRGMREFMSNLRAWHRWLAVEGEGRPTARAITGWSNAIFLFIVASGFYLWFPRKWTWAQVRSVLLFRGGLQGKARDFNWHNVIGFWSAVPLFIVVASSMPISFPWANAFLYQMVGEEPPAPAGGGGGRAGRPAAAQGRNGGPGVAQERNAGPAVAEARNGGLEGTQGRNGQGRRETSVAPDGLNALWARAEQQVPDWRSISVRIPNGPSAPVSFAIDQGDGGQPQLRSTLVLDRETGAVVSYESFASQSLGRRIRSISRFAHTGEVLGIPGQTVAGLVSAGGAVLVWTGLALAWRRVQAWLKRRSERSVEIPAITRTPVRELVQVEEQR
jgi:uncharacterized iron-regulated membrane protein